MISVLYMKSCKQAAKQRRRKVFVYLDDVGREASTIHRSMVPCDRTYFVVWQSGIVITVSV